MKSKPKCLKYRNLTVHGAEVANLLGLSLLLIFVFTFTPGQRTAFAADDLVEALPGIGHEVVNLGKRTILVTGWTGDGNTPFSLIAEGGLEYPDSLVMTVGKPKPGSLRLNIAPILVSFLLEARVDYDWGNREFSGRGVCVKNQYGTLAAKDFRAMRVFAFARSDLTLPSWANGTLHECEVVKERDS